MQEKGLYAQICAVFCVFTVCLFVGRLILRIIAPVQLPCWSVDSSVLGDPLANDVELFIEEGERIILDEGMWGVMYSNCMPLCS